jgi:hypothetical protein
MKWFSKKLTENSSRLAVGSAIGAVAGAASGTVDWNTAIFVLLQSIAFFVTPEQPTATPPAK